MVIRHPLTAYYNSFVINSIAIRDLTYFGDGGHIARSNKYQALLIVLLRKHSLGSDDVIRLPIDFDFEC